MNDFIELRSVFMTLLKGWWLLLLLTTAGAVAGYVARNEQPIEYEATTTILVGQSIKTTEVTREGLLVSQVLARTYVNIVRSQLVLQSVADSLDLKQNWQSLEGQVTANTIDETQLFQIKVEGSTAEEARIIADEVARQLILLSPTAGQDRTLAESQLYVRQRLQTLQAKIEAGEQRLEALNASMSGLLTAEQVQELQQEIDTVENLLTSWENTYTELLIFVESKDSPNQLLVIEPAQAKAQSSNTKLLTIIGGLLGFSLAAGLLFLRDFFDDTLKSKEQLEPLGLTSLGTINPIRARVSRYKLIAAETPASPVTEAYRVIRNKIHYSAGQPIKTLLVTSPTAGEGKSVTVANLAVVIAQAGFSTVIVDGNLRNPSQHYIFQVPLEQGLTDLLDSSGENLNGYLKPSQIKNLKILTCGSLAINPAELLGAPDMKQVLDNLQEIADVIICDSPPVLEAVDASVLAHQVDGVVLVIRAKRTRLDAAQQAIADLQQVKANILGSVFNRISGWNWSYPRYKFFNRRHLTKGEGGPPKVKTRRRLPFRSTR